MKINRELARPMEGGIFIPDQSLTIKGQTRNWLATFDLSANSHFGRLPRELSLCGQFARNLSNAVDNAIFNNRWRELSVVLPTEDQVAEFITWELINDGRRLRPRVTRFEPADNPSKLAGTSYQQTPISFLYLEETTTACDRAVVISRQIVAVERLP